MKLQITIQDCNDGSKSEVMVYTIEKSKTLNEAIKELQNKDEYFEELFEEARDLAEKTFDLEEDESFIYSNEFYDLQKKYIYSKLEKKIIEAILKIENNDIEKRLLQTKDIIDYIECRINERKEMINKLGSLHYNLIEPSSSWEEIGFTERPLWINNKGWGYIMCDEPCDFGKIEAFSGDKWIIIREKLKNKKLKFEDIEETDLDDIWLISDCYEDDEEDEDLDDYNGLNSMLQGLLSLPEKLGKYIYWAHTDDGIAFFSKKEALYDAIDFRDCYECWENMDNKTLEIWIERISSELGDIFNK